jgi:20S proteasome alpha/beta subunit
MATQGSNTKLAKGGPVTVGIVVACKDGVVVGADRKVTMSRGTRIKSLEDKVFHLSFKDGRNLLVCGSGGTDLVRRAIGQINPSDCDKDVDAFSYRDIVERNIALLRRMLAERALDYDADLLFGMVDTDNRPFIGHITASGLTETRVTGYYTTGVGAPYAELVLQDSYSENINVEDAKLIVGGLIEKIGTVDNDVEGMDVFWIATRDRQVGKLAWWERMGISREPLSFDFREELSDLKGEIGRLRDFAMKALEEAETKKREEEEKRGAKKKRGREKS